EPDLRGTFSILSTCIVTLVLCVWTAIHLNAPEHKEGAIKLYMRKCGWMLLGLLIPELIAYTTFQQYQQARNIAREMNSSDGWGYPSSNFAKDNDDDGLPPTEEKSKRRSPKRSTGIQRTRLTITNRGLECLKNNGYGHIIPTRSLEHIRDKSKGNTMAKILVCIQASWFCIQCLTRFAQGLAISLLELNTFGHAICTFFIYIM
ncbi:hypothetical protein B0H65DRAFT_421390, partial [Neurospora tetraspora]